MAKINFAFETLNDPERRREYDASLGSSQGEVRFKYSPKKPVQVKLVKRFRAHKTPVYAVAFTPDDRYLVSAAFDNEVVWWDIANVSPMRKERLEGGVISTLKPLRDGGMVAAGSSENLLSVWRVGDDGVDSTRLNRDDWVSCVALTNDGGAVGCGTVHHKVLINSAAKRLSKGGHLDSVTAVAWSADGKILASGSADNTVRLWKRADGSHLMTIQAIRSTVTAIAFSPDNRFIAVAAVDLSIRVFSLKDGMLQKMMFGHTRPIEALAFHPNGWLFASGGRDGAVKIWNADKGIGQLHISASHLAIQTLAFSRDGSHLAASGLDKHIRIWELTVRG